MVSETVALLISIIATPFVVSIVAAPTLFSKTFVQTLLQGTFSFDRLLLKTYAKRMFLVSTTISVFWGSLVFIGDSSQLQLTEAFTQAFVGIAGIPIFVLIIYIVSYPERTQQKLVTVDEFRPTEKRHQFILGSVLLVQVIALLLVFFGIIIIV